MTPLCFATRNNYKTEEIRALLGPFFVLRNLNDIGCVEELAETQNTIEGNALQKASYVFDHYQVSCFADDTGLEVDALRGEPGVFSARYARMNGIVGTGDEHKNSEDNIDLLLARLEGIENRSARFKTVITLIDKGVVNNFEGIVYGTIIKERQGSKGFGYDSVFKPEGCERTFAEMELEEKNLISHRAIAVKKLINFLQERHQ